MSTTFKLLLGLGLSFASLSMAASDSPKGWFLAGSHPKDYVSGLDTHTVFSGLQSAFLASGNAEAQGFGTLMQSCSVGEFAGKRVRLTASVKAEKVSQWAGLWFRVDGSGGQSLAFDNMQSRPIQGTHDWKSVQIVLPVDTRATALAFGILLSGPGKVWIDELQFELVDESVLLTDLKTRNPTLKPKNLNFEE